MAGPEAILGDRNNAFISFPEGTFIAPNETITRGKLIRDISESKKISLTPLTEEGKRVKHWRKRVVKDVYDNANYINNREQQSMEEEDKIWPMKNFEEDKELQTARDATARLKAEIAERAIHLFVLGGYSTIFFVASKEFQAFAPNFILKYIGALFVCAAVVDQLIYEYCKSEDKAHR